MDAKLYTVPLLTGVVVFGAVTAFAAGFWVNSDTVLSGNAGVPGCNNSAQVRYSTTYDSALPGYEVAKAFVTTSTGCNGMEYRVSLLGAGDVSLAEMTGSLTEEGTTSPDFSANAIPASAVLGAAVTITGTRPGA